MLEKTKKYDLEDRCSAFARKAMDYVDKLPRSTTNIEIGRQLARSAGSVGANYIEANESLSKKDFVLRIKISRKEAKETTYWLKLSKPREDIESEKELLVKESIELMSIFGAILKKFQ